MKQTNNAIKFLMAQYRAIFKNANIAMVAAMAAATLAAGQAQAAAGDDGLNPLGKFETELKDSIIGKDDNLTHSADKYAVLSAPANKPISVENGGKLTLSYTGKAAKGNLYTGNDLVVNSGGTITLKGSEDAKADIAGLVGAAKETSGQDRATPTASLTINKDGKLDVTSSFAMMKDVNINGTVSIKGTTGKNTADAQSGEYLKYAAVYAEAGNLTVGNDAAVTLGAASHLYGQNIAINGGTIAFEGSTAAGKATALNGGALLRAGDSKNGGALTISNGKLNVAKGKSGDIVATTLNMNGGEINVSGTMGIGGNYHDDAPAATININKGKVTVATDGTLKLNGEVTFADGTVANSGTIEALNGSKINVANTAGLYSTDGALKLTGATLNLTGTALDLSDANVSGNATSALTAENAAVTVKEGFKSKVASITAASVTASKEDGNFALKSGESITVSKGLTVTPKSDKATLKVGGALTLTGTGGAVNADVTLAQDTSGTPSLTVDNGTWTLPSLTITSGTASVTSGAVLSINGKLDIANATTNGTLSVDAATVNLTTKDSDLSLKGAGVVKLKNTAKLNVKAEDVFKNDNGTIALVDGGTFVQNAVSGDSSSVLNLNNGGSLSKEQLKSLITAVGFEGIISGVSLNASDRPADGSALSQDMAGTDAYKDVQVKVNANIDKQYSVDSVVLDSVDAMTVAAGGTMILNGPKNEMFVSKAGQVANVKLSDANASLVLAGSGKIGDITAETAAGNGKVTIGSQADGGNVTVGAIGGTNALGSLTVNENVNVTATGDINAQAFVFNGNELKAGGKAISVGGTNSNTKIMGDVTAKSLTYSGNGTHIIAGDAEVKLDTLDFGSGSVQIGDDAAEANGSATVVVKNLSGTGTLFVDPAYGQKAALVIADSLGAASTPDDKDAGTLSGSAIVGNNAALGIGFASEADLKAVLGQFLDANGSFTENPAADKLELANALVLNKQITIDSNKGITVKKGATKNDNPSGNSVTLDAGTGLIVTDNVYKVNEDGSKSGAAITFSGTGTVNGSGGKVILSGSFDGEDNAIEIFKNANTFNGTIKVQSVNGLLEGTIDGTSANNKGNVDLNVDEDALKGAFTGVSAPVAELLKNTIRGEFKGAQGLGADFVYSVAGTSLTGAEVDAAAHAATYAGAQQAAVAAVTTMADAMFGRVGAVGVEAASISATGSQANGGVWLTPMYKNVDSDGFNAEGVSYGSDVDLAGVAFGTDTVNGNMRFGAVFNIGSGDAEGKGQGNGLKDEFDYYGFGIYSAMGFGNFALVGDASMTVISHDVEGFGLKGKADTTAVTMGVTGQYTVSTPMVDVTPHLGARFIRLNTDSYDLTSADGVLATTDFDVQNVFSVPVGVTLSKAFVAGGWSLAPSADLTIAFNTGDTDAKSNTQFNSSKSMSVATNTEVLDEVQYGVTLGLGAQYGAFGTSFGINYTGSSNTDSLGVNAQARYMF